MATNLTEAKEPGFAERLRADLLAGRYRPGEWLKQADLENQYGANRFEVRIALSELAARHLIDHFPNRGYRVANPTDRQREELYEVRTILETSAARLAATRASPDDIDQFERLVREFDAAIESGGRGELVRSNFRLHDHFCSMAGNQLLAAQIRELRERGHPRISGGWETVAAIRTSSADHFDMLEMLRRRDPDGLVHVVYRHLNRWRKDSATQGK